MATKGTVLTTNESGASWIKMLVGTKTWDPANIASDAATATLTTVTIPGARAGDPVIAAHTANTGWSGAAVSEMLASVTADDTVSVSVFNKMGAALNLASGTLKVIVFKI